MIAGITLGSILLGVALILVVVLYLARPFVTAEAEDVRLAREEIDSLVLRRDALLRQVRELDDDMEAAKVAPELYQRVRPQLVKQAAVLMQQLDAHTVAVVAPDLDAQIEAAVRRLRTPEELDADIEAAVQAARAKSPVGAPAAGVAPAGFCPKCGRRVEPDDRFCPKCGYAFQEPSKPQAARA